MILSAELYIGEESIIIVETQGWIVMPSFDSLSTSDAVEGSFKV